MPCFSQVTFVGRAVKKVNNQDVPIPGISVTVLENNVSHDNIQPTDAKGLFRIKFTRNSDLDKDITIRLYKADGSFQPASFIERVRSTDQPERFELMPATIRAKIATQPERPKKKEKKDTPVITKPLQVDGFFPDSTGGSAILRFEATVIRFSKVVGNHTGDFGNPIKPYYISEPLTRQSLFQLANKNQIMDSMPAPLEKHLPINTIFLEDALELAKMYDCELPSDVDIVNAVKANKITFDDTHIYYSLYQKLLGTVSYEPGNSQGVWRDYRLNLYQNNASIRPKGIVRLVRLVNPVDRNTALSDPVERINYYRTLVSNSRNDNLLDEALNFFSDRLSRVTKPMDDTIIWRNADWIIESLAKQLLFEHSEKTTENIYALAGVISEKYRMKTEVLLRFDIPLKMNYEKSKHFLGELLFEGYKKHLLMDAETAHIDPDSTHDCREIYEFIKKGIDTGYISSCMMMAQVDLADSNILFSKLPKLEKGWNWAEKIDYSTLPETLLKYKLKQIVGMSVLKDTVLTADMPFYLARMNLIRQFFRHLYQYGLLPGKELYSNQFASLYNKGLTIKKELLQKEMQTDYFLFENITAAYSGTK
jgi:hypothetical protein